MRVVIAVSLVLIGFHTAVGSFRPKSLSGLPSCPADLQLNTYAELGKNGSLCATGNRKLLKRRFMNGRCAKGHECCRSASGIGICNLKKPCDSVNGFVKSPTLGCLKYSPPGSVTSYDGAQAECQNTGRGNDLVSLTNRKEFLEVIEVIHPTVSNTSDFIAIGLTLQDRDMCTFITASGEIVTQDSDLWVDDPGLPEGSSSPLICSNPLFQPMDDVVVGMALDTNSDLVPVDIPINFFNIDVNIGYICQHI